ncbi:MAG: serine/threonine protein kinase [Solirubrobacterales bacterium]|nr:serine/threonine protein kinase [Solirubrobacterales bacterium]
MGFRTHSLRERTTRALRPSARGTRLRDRFELLVPLGSGGFGTVYEGFDMLLERPVAIKELKIDQELTASGDALREARATARLNHPAIVSLYEIHAEGDCIYMINELVHGHTLGAMIDEGLMSDNDAGRIGYALCEALGHAHAQGVIHRDVKPANVMVTSAWLEGSGGWRVQPAKLMDFGIASIVDPGEHGGRAHAGPHAGSRGYVAPEQEAGEPASPASDVYSLALVLFECFTGAGPGKGRRSRLARARRDLPYELTGTIDRCLEPDPEFRPDVVELGQAIYDALPELSHNLAAPTITSRLRGLLGRTSRERSDRYTHGRPAQRVAARDQREWREPGSGRIWRFGIALLAAAMCVVTMLAASVTISFIQPLIAAALVFIFPRAGWALAATAGAVVLAIDGQVGSAMFLVLPAVVAALAAMVPLPRLLDGALAGAGAFAWVVAVQAMSGTSLALSLPEATTRPEDLRQYADIAAQAIVTFWHPAYTASLGLWALTGAAGVLLVDRRAAVPAWAVLGLAFVVAQVVIGQAMGMPVPALSIVVALLALGALICAAAATRRAGRVFAPTAGTGRHVRA